MSADAEPEPVLLPSPRGLQPYPFRLPHEDAEPVASLIAGLERMADQDGTDGSRAALLDPELLRRLERAIEQAERRVTRLIAELGGLPNEDALRTIGDLILARFSEIPSGVTSVSLEDFEGNGVVVELAPALAPHANASAYYDRAGKATRARARLPSLIANAESGLTTLRSLVERAGSGDAQASEIEGTVAPPAAVRELLRWPFDAARGGDLPGRWESLIPPRGSRHSTDREADRSPVFGR